MITEEEGGLLVNFDLSKILDAGVNRNIQYVVLQLCLIDLRLTV